MPDRQRHVVLVAGSANLDFVVRATHVPAPGETVLGREFTTFPGGKGANQAVAAARAGGVATRMLLALGDDAAAMQLEEALRDAGVEPLIHRQPDIASGAAFVCVADDGENAITVAPGANMRLAPEHLPALDDVACLLMQLEIPLETVAAYARHAKTRGVPVVLNAAPACELPHELLDCVDVLIVNLGELQAIAGGMHANAEEEIALQCAGIGVPCVVVTLGAEGALLWRADMPMIHQPSMPVEVVDTTGAGDVFCGVMAAAIARGADLVDGLREAIVASALACTRVGAQSGTPLREEVLALLQPPSAETAADAH